MSTSDLDEDAYYEDDDYNYYYQSNDDECIDDYMENSAEKIRRNIESFDYECITLEEGKAYIESIIDKTAKTLDVS